MVGPEEYLGGNSGKIVNSVIGFDLNETKATLKLISYVIKFMIYHR